MNFSHNLMKREFSFEDLPAMSKLAKSSSLLFDALPCETPKTGLNLPVGGVTTMEFPDNHFMYMTTWFFTSFFSGLMYLKYIR